MTTTNGNTARIRMPDGSIKTVSTVRGGAYDRYTSQGGVVISGSSRSSTPTPTPTPAPTTNSSRSSGGSSYSGPSIVDYLGSLGQASDFNTRSGIAAEYGISGYTGTSAQNTQLLNAMRSGSMTSSQAPATTSTPTTPQITSSSTPVVTNNTREGMKTGANSLVGAFGGGAEEQWLQQFTNTQIKTQDEFAERSMALIGKKIDLALARSNTQYGNLMKDLGKNYQTSLSVAKTQAAAINPYGSQSTSEMEYSDTLTKNYEEGAERLTNEARMAQEALELGEIEAYMNIQKSMKDNYAQLTQNLYSALTDIRAQKTQQEQFAVTTNLAQYDNYLATLKSVQTPDPDELKNMTPEQLFQTTFFQQGLKAGLSPNEIMKDLVNQSDYNSKLMSIDQARVAQGWQGLALEGERNQLSRESNKTLIQQNIIAGISQIPAPTPGSDKKAQLDYTKEIMGLSAGGKTDFRIADNAAKYESAANELGNIKASIDALSDSDPIINIAAGYLPYSEKVKKLEAEVARISPIVGRGVLGDSGTFTETDRKVVATGIASAKNTAEVRAALFNSMVDLLADKSNITLAAYARQGYDVSAFTPTIDQINYYRDKSKVSTTPQQSQQTGGFQYQAPTIDWSKFK